MVLLLTVPLLTAGLSVAALHLLLHLLAAGLVLHTLGLILATSSSAGLLSLLLADVGGAIL